jgi:hypothetical protein
MTSANLTYESGFKLIDDLGTPLNFEAATPVPTTVTWDRHSTSPFDRAAYAIITALGAPLLEAKITTTPPLVTLQADAPNPGYRFVITLTPDLRASTFIAAPSPEDPKLVTSLRRRAHQLPAEGDPSSLIAWLGMALDFLEQEAPTVINQGPFTAHSFPNNQGTGSTVQITRTRSTHDPRPLLCGTYATTTLGPQAAAMQALRTLNLAIADLRVGRPPDQAPTLNRILSAMDDGETFTVNNNTWTLRTEPGKRGMPSFHCGNVTIEPVTWDRKRTAGAFMHDPGGWKWKASTKTGNYPHPFAAMNALK